VIGTRKLRTACSYRNDQGSLVGGWVPLDRKVLKEGRGRLNTSRITAYACGIIIAKVTGDGGHCGGSRWRRQEPFGENGEGCGARLFKGR